MESARVAIFEDDKSIRYLLAIILSDHGHTVELQAGTMQKAREAIASLDEDSLDIAVVDGNLDSGNLNGADGAEIAASLRAKSARVAIIGFSATGDVEGADLNVYKDPRAVIGIINELDRDELRRLSI